MNNKRRNRSNAARSRSPEQLAQGVYTNQQFTHTSAGLVGTDVQVETTNGSRYKGILSTFSSQFEVVLEYAHTVYSTENIDSLELKKPSSRMIFNPQNIVHMVIKNVDPLFASRDGSFQTDSSISKYDRNGQGSGEKELQPWIEDCNGDEMELTLGSEPGWDPNDMFKLNEDKYGVRSSFDHSLSGYTLPLERSESKGYKEAEAKAARIANEIEKNPSTRARLDLENGDEEDVYAAVTRPGMERSSPPRSDNKAKYIPPDRRPANSFQGRLTPRSTPFPPGRNPPPPPPPVEEPPENNLHERGTPPGSSSDDNRNNNSPSSAHSVSSPNLMQQQPPVQQIPVHPRNGNGARNKTYMVPNYGYPQQQPRYPPPAPPQMVSHRAMPPSAVVNQPPLQHGPPPQSLPIVFGPPLPPNHAHQNQLPPVMPQETVSQSVQVQQANLPPNQSIAMMHGMEPPGMRDPSITHVHLPPHGVPHVHPAVPVVQGYVQQQPPSQQPPLQRDHELELRGHRAVSMRGQAPRVFQPANKRFPSAPFPPPPAPRKPRTEEVQDLSDFSSNLKLASEEEVEDKQESPPLDQWGKGRSPPSNTSAEDATLKKSTLNPNAKEFVYNPSAKPFTPRPPNTPGPSRPHTPQTPAQQYGYSPGPVQTVMMPTAAYVMQSAAFPHQSQQHRVQMTPRPDITQSQMQVAAATGQPLLAPAPVQRFIAPYPNPPPQPYQQMVRMVPSQGGPMMFHPDGGPHVQYMSPHAPQPHPSGQFQQAQHQQFPATMVYSIPQAAMLQYFQQPHGQPGQQQHVQVIVPSNP